MSKLLHCGKQGIAEDLAQGLAVFLNCTVAEERFRRFSGHTQVNATNLRLMKYPSRDTLLTRLGVWARSQKKLDQEKIDKKIGNYSGLPLQKTPNKTEC